MLNFNPRSPWGERLLITLIIFLLERISIHAPRGGSDTGRLSKYVRADYFNPRSPWGERPMPTPPPLDVRYFNPRSPCGERPFNAGEVIPIYCISIHAPRVGSDFIRLVIFALTLVFQSTLPVWGATFNAGKLIPIYCISIHAPRVGSDWQGGTQSMGNLSISIHAPRVGSDSRRPKNAGQRAYFNPRSPCGERLSKYVRAD